MRRAASLEMIARIIARGHDTVTIRETGRLNGEGARAVLNWYLAFKDDSRAEVYSTLRAAAPMPAGTSTARRSSRAGPGQGRAYSPGHHPLAHVTHEAAIGRVDSKQLETLMSRAPEDAATDLIIEGLLS